jgi:hypothetical protein
MAYGSQRSVVPRRQRFPKCDDVWDKTAAQYSIRAQEFWILIPKRGKGKNSEDETIEAGQDLGQARVRF